MPLPYGLSPSKTPYSLVKRCTDAALEGYVKRTLTLCAVEIPEGKEISCCFMPTHGARRVVLGAQSPSRRYLTIVQLFAAAPPFIFN
jgi:hypothetical protein